MIGTIFSAIALHAASPSETILAKLNVLTEHGAYNFIVMESDVTGKDRVLHITSDGGCIPAATIDMPAKGFPLGVFRISDKYDLVVVTWGAATGTVVQVYSITNCHVTKVFDRPASSLNRIGVDHDGRPVIRTIEKLNARSGGIPREWRWDGNKFKSR